jgi:type I restriction-modification system DNA methylase subunit
MRERYVKTVEDASFVRHDNTLARPYVSYTHADCVDVILTNPLFGASVQDGIESNFPQHFRTKETADLFLALIIRSWCQYPVAPSGIWRIPSQMEVVLS